MSYGLTCNGEGGQTIIDNEHSVLHIMAAGSYSATSGKTSVVYPSTINTVSPPIVFISPDGPANNTYFKHKGSPGNWLGFDMEVINEPATNNGYSPTGKYRACAINPPKLGGYGLQLFDPISGVVFDSNYRLMNFISGQQTWKMSYTVPLTSFQRGVVYRLPWVSANNYFVVSSFGSDMVNSGQFASFVSIGFADFNKSVVQVVYVGLTNAPISDINIPLLVGKPTGE